MSPPSCLPAQRSRLAPLAVIALLTALGHMVLIDAVAHSAPAIAVRVEPAAPDAPRARAVFTQFVAPQVAFTEPVVAPPPAAIAPAMPVAVHAKRPTARPALAKAHEQARTQAAAAVDPQWLQARFEVPMSPAGETTDDTVAAQRPAEPALMAAASGPDETNSEPAIERLPVYPTRIPGAFRFVYQMSRGLISGRGELALRLTADGYEAKLEGSVAGFSILEWTSRGAFDEAGFAPLRFTDQRRGRGVQAANFQRANHRIIYSGSKVEAPLPPGAQDRLSWMLQLAAIAQARPERLAEGERITLFVSGARGDADAWSFQVGARTRLETPAGAAQVVPLLREPRKEYDMRAQVWLDPARDYLPVKARLQSSREGGDALELVLQEVQAP
jgi:hypothetical protein